MVKDIDYYKKLSKKHYEIMAYLDMWLETKQNGGNLIDYFESQGYNNIAIYGTSFFSKRLQDELKNSCINIECVFDRNSIYDTCLKNAEVIVVTSTYYYYEIYNTLKSIFNLPIVSIANIIMYSSNR